MRHDDVIADVFLRPARSFSVVTQPGRKLHFNNGYTTIENDGDLQYVLGMKDASVRPAQRHAEHVADQIAGRAAPALCDIDVGTGSMAPDEYVQALRDTLRLGLLVGPLDANEEPDDESQVSDLDGIMNDEPDLTAWAAPKGRARKEN